MARELTDQEIDVIINENEVLSQVRDMYAAVGDLHKIDVLRNQTRKGLKKYGHTVDFAQKTVDEWSKHELEEIVDRDVYRTCGILREHLEWQRDRKYQHAKEHMANELLKIKPEDRASVLQTLADKYVRK